MWCGCCGTNGTSGITAWLEVVDEPEVTKHNLGVDVMLDFHFSDTPAARQPDPAWGMGHVDLKEAMTCHVRCALEAWKPDVPRRWSNLATKSTRNDVAPRGVGNDVLPFRNCCRPVPMPARGLPNGLVAVHVADLPAAPWFFDNLASAGFVPTCWPSVDTATCTSLGLWQTMWLTLSSLRNRPVFLAETPHAWTSDWADWTDNLCLWTGDETPVETRSVPVDEEQRRPGLFTWQRWTVRLLGTPNVCAVVLLGA